MNSFKNLINIPFFFVIFIIVVNVLYNPQNGNRFGVAGERYIACTVGYCSSIAKCPEFSCRGRNKLVFKNVTKCECCHRCIEEHGENEQCPGSITGNIPNDQCGPHLKCVKQESKMYQCSKIDSACERQRKAIEENPSQAFIWAPKPDCDDFGEFKPKQCKEGSL